ncbi:FAD-dependent oxidoreductase [Microbispora sp. ZYX-F-249]|uniref:FAD-dependent oxidoreductase n=1 Tax=Microbispora maris TaxID=3144104 RepID=A0ABV0ANN6_9ACTN
MAEPMTTNPRVQDTPTVLIVGAGPTGLTLACELARSGVPFRLIDAAPGPRPGSRGKGVQPRSLEVFEDLGIVDRVLANGWMAMPMHATAPDGRVTRGGAVPKSLTNRPDIPYAASLITPQWRVEEALRVRLSELGGAVEFGTVLVGFDQSDDVVTAEVVAGGMAETVRTRWLVGCDGGHSVVRKQAGIPFVGETLEDVRMIVADLPVDGLDRDAWHAWQHPEGLLSLCPLPSTGLFQYAAGIAPGQDPGLGLAHLRAILERRTGRTDIRLHEPQWSSLWRANIRLADRYREGNVFLAGDAAHVHSPAGGQGMNTGIQDAHNLGWKLAAVANDGAAFELLDSYEAERRPVATHVLALSNARLKQALEIQAAPTRRDASTIQLDVGYRGSALARDDRDDAAALRAGDRAPDATKLATVEGERRLFDLTRGGRFTLLAFGPATPAEVAQHGLRTLHVVGHPTGPDDIADTEGHLAAAYDASDRTLVLIRPDGHVGLISDAGDVRAVTGYLAAIGRPSQPIFDFRSASVP